MGTPKLRLRHFIWVLPLVLLVQLFLQTWESTSRSTNGFVAVYTASTIAARDGKASQLYNQESFREEVHQFEPNVIDVNFNPPSLATWMIPSTWLPYRTSRKVWVWASLVALLLSLALISRELGWGSIASAFWFALGLGSANTLECLRLGQVYLVVLLLWTVAWWFWRHGRALLAGAIFGIPLATKLLGLWMVWIFVRARRPLAVVGLFVGSGLVVLLSTLHLGVGPWREFFALARAASHAPESAVTAYQTVGGFFLHLFRFHPGWNKAPLFDAPFLAEWVGTVLIIGLWLGWVAWVLMERDGRSPQPAGRAGLAASVESAEPTGLAESGGISDREHGFAERALAVGILLGLITSPLSLDYHYPLSLLAIALLAHQLFSRFKVQGGQRAGALWASLPRRGLATAMVFGLAVLLIHADLPYRSPRLADGARAIFAYPKLAGALMLMALAIVPDRFLGQSRSRR